MRRVIRVARIMVHYFLTLRLRSRLKSVGKRVYLHPSAKFSGCSNICIGDYSAIVGEADIRGTGGLIIGENVIIAPGVTVLTSSHRYKGADMLPFDYVKIARPVTISDNVWIGMHVRINPGVKIGEGAILAMGAVVTKDVPPLTIVGGNPAKKIGERNFGEYEELKRKRKYYNMYSIQKETWI